MIYTGLSTGLPSITLLAICGGLWLDSLSANPLGVTVLPLFIVGLVVQRYRGLILRDQRFAQMVHRRLRQRRGAADDVDCAAQHSPQAAASGGFRFGNGR